MTGEPSRGSCPVCRRPVPSRAGNAAWPFCSSRCKLLDLGKWLGEDYRIPGGRAGDGAALPPADEEEGQ